MYSTLIMENLKKTFEEIEETFKTKFISPAKNPILKNKSMNKKLKFNEQILEFLINIFFFLKLIN